MTEASLKEFSSLEIDPLIADRPAEPRDASRLLAVRRSDGALLHRRFADLPEFLGPKDLLVLNRSKVWKARLEAVKATGGKSEILLMAPCGADNLVWTGLCRKITPGQVLTCPAGRQAECLARNPDGSYTFRFSAPVDEAYLAANGAVPLPQYILKARARRGVEAPPDEPNYQTVYAAEAGSIAAHTAGFHFTPDLFSRLAAAGVKTAFVTLHIGWGTFRPVRSEDPAAHVMMEEACSVPAAAAAAINEHKSAGGRIVAVGTSSMRTLETFSDENGVVASGSGKAGLFIRPGYNFKVAGAFITNLHVPESAPLYMTAAFAGRELLLKAYTEAVKEKYRFYSYGDSMLVL
ncbi:MAG: tRNA preQ1(34) S-adenosylmethionine ribosyltransferase-isomerase QueA [Elusimicrobia bacterium GWA2_61_42]|nr:MAG: tRNA preQ1(34) S-adenosylmethionine ribosyltransferase-isomerase QueA [Elusimicrobia bacterium GWA2_61_42]OGR80434.1 MAG: tRNA preQ1(34) S-adenosylmethionine ribosyltransferase-isomerase QueA [Elusimicrobia bacterium GWC2_61_25]